MKLDYFAKNLILYFIGIALIFSFGGGCGKSKVAYMPTAEEQYRKAMKEYQREHYTEAVAEFQKVIYNFSGSSLVDSAQYYLAMSHFNDKDYYLAANEFVRLANGFPGSPLIDDAQYMAGFSYFKAAPNNYGLDQNELSQAIQQLEEFLIDYPDSDLAPDARQAIKEAKGRLARKNYEAGRLYFRLGYLESARIYFQLVVDDYTDSEWAPKALFRLAEIEQKKKNYDEATRLFNNFLTVYPDHEYAGKAGKKLDELKAKIAESQENN